MFFIWHKPQDFSANFDCFSTNDKEEAEAKITALIASGTQIFRVIQGIEIEFEPVEIVKSVRLKVESDE